MPPPIRSEIPGAPVRAITLCIPELGGVYTVVASLAKSLAPLGVSLSWLEAGKRLSEWADRHVSPEDRETGSVLATEDDADLTRARSLMRQIASDQPSIVILHAFGGAVELNLARYLPAEVLRLLVVHNISPATYSAAAAIRDHVHATVAVSPRIESDLVNRFGFDPRWTLMIPNGIDVVALALPRPARVPNTLRVLSHGRVEDGAKGVKWLPAIVSRAARGGANIQLTVSGDGPDLPWLVSRFASAGLSGTVRFLGPVHRDRVATLMAEHDVLLMASRFEGFPLTLLEAMAAGCVPVATHIREVTDFAVKAEHDGLLFAPGAVRQAASHLVRLAGDPELLDSLSSSARLSAARFSREEQAASYASLIASVLENPRDIAPPLEIGDWSLPPGLRDSWRTSLPTPLKNLLRVARERMAWLPI